MSANIEQAARWFYSSVPIGVDHSTGTAYGARDTKFRRDYATRLAQAEQWAMDNGAAFGWSIDSEIQFDDATPAWRCSLHLNGELVAQGCPEEFGLDHPWNDEYGLSRVSEAALALGYLTERQCAQAKPPKRRVRRSRLLCGV